MKKLAIFLVFSGLLAISLSTLFARRAAAIPGDIDGDGNLNPMTDIIYFANYLFRGGTPPPNPLDADLDGSPGINLGDMLQLIGYWYSSCAFLPYTGASVRVGSQIRFSSDLIYSMESGITDTTYLKIIENGGPDLTGIVIPLSYANQPHEVDVTLDSVSFWGGIIPPYEPGWTNNVFIDAIKPDGDKCRVCGGDLKSRSDDQDEDAIDKRHNIYYDTETGTTASVNYYKGLSAKRDGRPKVIEVDGGPGVKEVSADLMGKLG